MVDVKHIYNGNNLLAILVPAEYSSAGIEFFTPDEFSQQMAYMRHPAGKVIEPHVHNAVKREVFYTNEALFVRKGEIRVDFYDDDKAYLWSTIIRSGDVLLLVSGGHGFEVISDCEMIEIKQGPYAGEGDKTRFARVSVDRVRLETQS